MNKITRATLDNITIVSNLLFYMHREVDPEKSTTDMSKYVELARTYLVQDYVYLGNGNQAIFIMRDISSPVIDRKIWDGVSVYIKPEFRKSRLLSDMYNHMFDNHKGSIIGFIEPQSSHLKIVGKRNSLLGYLYNIEDKRSK